MQTVKEFQQHDKRIRYIRQVENEGALYNFQFVLHQAIGKYFMWAADDDFWMPEFVRTMVEQLEKNKESSVAMSAVRRLWENATTYDIVRFSGALDPSKMSYFELGMALASGEKYNLYIYGLYRTDFLKLAASHIPAVVASDRLFVCQVALATRFSYVDEVLHVRNVNSKPIAERYKDESLGSEHRNIFSTEKTLLTLGPYLWNSKVIPFSRKLYIPLLVLRYAFIDLSFGYRLRRFVGSYLTDLIRKNLAIKK
jgi:glycosyltransferase involved in cell wall biosynthesis